MNTAHTVTAMLTALLLASVIFTLGYIPEETESAAVQQTEKSVGFSDSALKKFIPENPTKEEIRTLLYITVTNTDLYRQYEETPKICPYEVSDGKLIFAR